MTEGESPSRDREEGTCPPAGDLAAALHKAWSEERGVLLALLRDNLAEQRRERRLKNGFRLFIIFYLLLLLGLGYRSDLSRLSHGEGVGSSHTALVVLEGEIFPGSDADAEQIIPALQDAFDHDQTRAVVLRINSPGGSPVQAGRIHDEMLRLRKKYPAIPLYAVLEDICASGGYYVAAAAQAVYADKATLVGSIGVILRGFGLREAMTRLGVESRLLTAGENKAFLDPFEPFKEKERAHAQTLLDGIHRQFVTAVQNGRGDRLKADRETLFNGLIWTGEEAVKLGLVDDLGSVDWVARDVVKVEKLVDFSPRHEWWEKFSHGVVSHVGRWVASQVAGAWGIR